MKELIEQIQSADSPDAVAALAKSNNTEDLQAAAVEVGLGISELTTKLKLAQAIFTAQPSITPEEVEPEVELEGKDKRIKMLRDDIVILEKELDQLKKELTELTTLPPQKEVSQHELLQAIRAQDKAAQVAGEDA
jgi:hypothetical protein